MSQHPHPANSSRKPLLLAALVVLVYFFIEIAGAVISDSLALLADAFHTVSDVGALGLAFAASWLASRPGDASRTFGYLRAEVLAALVNGAVLLGITVFVFIEAAERLSAPPDVEGGLVSLVAVGGVTVNVIAAFLLMRGARHSMNVRAALLHVAGDALGSLGAIISGVLVVLFGWYVADPIASIFIGVLLLLGALRLLREATHVLLEGSPSHIDVAGLLQDIKALPGVQDVHDLHAWSITSGYDAMSAHVTMCDDLTRRQEGELLSELRRMVGERYGIAHVTVQMERGTPDCHEGHLPLTESKSRKDRQPTASGHS